MTELEEHLEIDRKKVENSVRLHVPIEITSYTLPRNMDVYFHRVADMFLEVCHQEHLKEYINFSLGELLTNSKKANTKRVYFQEKNLDINDPNDYSAGMEHFKDDTNANLEHYLELQKKEGYYIKLSMQFIDNKIVLEIKNNALLTSFENERIKHKIATAQQYDNMDEVIANVIDQSEGAGLGIIIIILMLQKVGYSRENYRVFCTDTETVTQIILPCDKKISAGVEIASYEFVYMQDTIPVLKSTYEKVNEIVKAEFINRNDLLECLRNDISLSLLILKYSLEKDSKCFNLPKALQILSDQDLKFIFSESNPSSRFIDETQEIDDIKLHSCKTAYYAYNLYKNKDEKGLSVTDEGMYLLGLLNSVGSLLLTAATKEQKDYISELCSQYDTMSGKIHDVFYLGNASNYIGLIFTKRLGLSDSVASIFNEWNSLNCGNNENKTVIKILYLAEMIVYYSERAIEFYQINKDALGEFNIESENQLKSIINKVSEKTA